MTEKKMTAGQLKRAKKLAERLKKYPEIDNPHALARWIVQHNHRVALRKARKAKRK